MEAGSDGQRVQLSRSLLVGFAAGLLVSVWQAFGPLDYVGWSRMLPVAAVNLAIGLLLAAVSWLAVRRAGRAAGLLASLAVIVATGVFGYANVRRDIDVLLYLSDAQNVQHLSLYGYERETTPTLDRLAREDGTVVFEQAIAQGSYTWGGAPAVMASVYPSMVGMRSSYTQGLADKVTTLAEALKSAGYTTCGLVANPHLTRTSNFDQGFDHYEDSRHWVHAFDAAAATKLFAYWHRRAAGRKPRFGLVFVVDCHAGLYPATVEDVRRFRPEFDLAIERRHKVIDHEAWQALTTRPEDLIAFYDASVRIVDHSFGALLEYLKTSGDLDNTLLVFTSDHGEEFWQHGDLGHPGKLYDEAIRIPLLVRFPSPVHFPRLRPVTLRFPDQVGQIDIMPTVLRFVGAPTDIPAMRGRNLLPYIYGRARYDPDRPLLSEVYLAKRRMRSWRTSRWKYIAYYAMRNGKDQVVKEQLFDLLIDPDEKLDMARTEGKLVSRYSAAVAAEVRSMQPYAVEPAEVRLTEEELRGLRALGYLK